MKKISFNEALDMILSEDPRYAPESYDFVREALDFTLKTHKKDSKNPNRHVSGQELLEGIRDYAIAEFGPMSRTVLAYWGIEKCEDFGHIVFNMVDKGILGKTDHDRVEDFYVGYDFAEAFDAPFRPKGKTAAKSKRNKTLRAGIHPE
ncbi:hypothetical protein QPK87_13110 [Kamptonema cortianum]|uniref:Uncharacterized protein n=1 Tax=Geitlerinema calcuttense NRMC-F 0142 TaxID=2922238 RepID=A0ABT7LY52_9CYAN|nr:MULTISPECIES: Minf_1886 family protein [Cyanophyceae]MDK3157507.1 hypothetical protein [Kamptonema cortianum]MDL5052618.1 hypothetical protein [Oscillatoria laete-virens NRMC-F 0139]MDL5056923.1 hypothetical protein [Geitlerinema calcuttense NRMC-F 0142]